MCTVHRKTKILQFLKMAKQITKVIWEGEHKMFNVWEKSFWESLKFFLHILLSLVKLHMYGHSISTQDV